MYAIGQKFDVAYPPEAAQWCNENGAMIARVDGGFEIQAIPAPTLEQFYVNLRINRNSRLAATDKYLLPDYPITAEALEQVKAYRAALRALPEQPGAPWPGGDIPWPVMPTVGA